MRSIAAGFIERGVSFRKFCGIVWGCCLKCKPPADAFCFRHHSDCPMVVHKSLIQFTTEGEQRKACPLCNRERGELSSGAGGLPKDLIRLIIKFCDPIK